jgi:hypothetical protein
VENKERLMLTCGKDTNFIFLLLRLMSGTPAPDALGAETSRVSRKALVIDVPPPLLAEPHTQLSVELILSYGTPVQVKESKRGNMVADNQCT